MKKAWKGGNESRTKVEDCVRTDIMLNEPPVLRILYVHLFVLSRAFAARRQLTQEVAVSDENYDGWIKTRRAGERGGRFPWDY